VTDLRKIPGLDQADQDRILGLNADVLFDRVG